MASYPCGKSGLKKDESIIVAEWKDALRVLGPSNGIECVQALGEVALREQMGSVIRRLVRPEKQWNDANVQGRTRICRVRICLLPFKVVYLCPCEC